MVGNSRYSLFMITKKAIQFLISKYTVQELKEEEGAIVYVSHHQNMIGPISTLVWLNKPIRPWVLSVFLNRNECYDQYVEYTFTKRFGLPRWLAKVVAFPSSYFVVALMKSGKAIPVYRESKKIIFTLRESIQTLKREEAVLVFPDIDYKDNSPQVNELYAGFLYLEKYYYKETQQHIKFIPLYSDFRTKKITAGVPIVFTGSIPFQQERRKIIHEIQESLNNLASTEKKAFQQTKI